jgi:hypothetical protein
MNAIALFWQKELITGKFEADYIKNKTLPIFMIQDILASDWFRIVE